MQVVDLLLEFELLDDVLYIAREAVEILEEVLSQSLCVGFATKAAHSKRRGVAEGVARRLEEYLLLCPLGDASLVELLAQRSYGFVGRLQEEIQPTKYHHREDNFLVITLLEVVHQHIIGDSPNEGKELVVLRWIHICI